MMYWDGGPNLSGWHGTPPNYNPLHPETRSAITTMVREMLDLYADRPAFKGVAFHLPKHTVLWFGDLDAGYNDVCIEGFERDTGIRIPVSPDDPTRVNRRFRWLMRNAKQEWIDWRCRAIHAFYEEIAEMLRSRRRDLKLILVLYRPNMKTVFSDPGFETAADYVRQVNREGGIDPELFRSSSNIVLQRVVFPADYRWWRVHRRDPEDPLRIRKLTTEPRMYDHLKPLPEAWINMHDRYWEDDIGRKSKWDAFWGRECAWRVSTLNPNARHCMESYAIPLSRVDAMTFTKGGFLIGTLGMETQLGRFSRAFRALPAQPFLTHPDSGPDWTVRYLPTDRGMYAYAVNGSPDPVTITLQLGGAPREVRNLADRSAIEIPGKRVTLKLAPYQLQSVFVTGKEPTLDNARADRQ